MSGDIVGNYPHPLAIILKGRIICHRDIIVDVDKTLETQISPHGRLVVRGLWYSYNAHIVGKYNILRYDNFHRDTPDEYHRHLFDLDTGRETSREIFGKSDMPYLADFLTEVANLVGFDPAQVE